MNQQLPEEKTILLDAISRLLKESPIVDSAGGAEPLWFDKQFWHSLVDVGLPGSRVDESQGGMALGVRDVAVFSYQAGYHNAPAPILESIIAAKLLSDISGGIALSWFDLIISGRCIVSVASKSVSRASRQTVSFGKIADAVIAFDGRELAIFSATSLKHEFRHTSEWNFKKSKREFMADGKKAAAAYEAAIAEWMLLLSAQILGACTKYLENLAELSTDRGKLGDGEEIFQEFSLPLSQCTIVNDRAKHLVDLAVGKLEQGNPDARAYISMAYWWTTQKCMQTIPKCAHSFGRNGLSVEHDIPPIARRGIALKSILGDRQQELLNMPGGLPMDVNV